MKFLVLLVAFAGLQANAELPKLGNYYCRADRAFNGGEVVVSTTDSINLTLSVSRSGPVAFVGNAEKVNAGLVVLGGRKTKVHAEPLAPAGNRGRIAAELPVVSKNSATLFNEPGQGMRITRMLLSPNYSGARGRGTAPILRTSAYFMYYYGDAHWERMYRCTFKH